MRNASARENHPTRFARSTIPEEKWGTTRSLLSNILFMTHFSLQKKNATNNTFVFLSLHSVHVQLVASLTTTSTRVKFRLTLKGRLSATVFNITPRTTTNCYSFHFCIYTFKGKALGVFPEIRISVTTRNSKWSKNSWFCDVQYVYDKSSFQLNTIHNVHNALIKILTSFK